MELAAFATGIVVAGDMSIWDWVSVLMAHGWWTIMIRVCKLGLLLVPWIVVLLIRIPSSPSSPITMSLTSIIILSSAPIRITLTFGISIPVISVAVIGVISIPLSSVPSKRVVLTSPSIVLKVQVDHFQQIFFNVFS